MFRFFILMFALLWQITCFGIVNGKLIQESLYPSVVFLYNTKHFAICTGTFISDYQILTAAHCVENSDAGEVHIVTVDRKDNTKLDFHAQANFIHQHPGYIRRYGSNPWDLAIVEFWSYSVKNFERIRSEGRVKKGEKVTLVGYGTTSVSKLNISETAGVKRIGQNKVKKVSERGYLYIDASLNRGPQSNAIGSFGDSGGPVFGDNFEIIGVWVRGTYSLEGIAIDLTSPTSREFLNSVF